MDDEKQESRTLVRPHRELLEESGDGLKSFEAFFSLSGNNEPHLRSFFPPGRTASSGGDSENCRVIQ